MTIHGAKGLEFPVCFVARVNKKFRFAGDNAALVKFDKTVGIVADYFDADSLCRYKTLLCDWEKRVNREFTIAEEMRKLYVAATRAQTKLIFTGGGDKIKSDSYAELLVKKLKSQQIANSLLTDCYHFATNLLTSPVFSQEAAADLGEYPRKILGTIPRKLTATQVGVVHDFQNHEHDEPTLFPRNPSFRGDKRLTGKKRGDAYHKVMAGEILTEFECNAVDFDDIDRFWKSELGRRVTESKKVEKEYKLYTEAPPIADFPDRSFVQGIADMFFYEDDGIVLVDYKTNRNTTAERLIHDYRGQLLIYKKAIEEMTGEKVKECWIYSFEIGAIEIL